MIRSLPIHFIGLSHYFYIGATSGQESQGSLLTWEQIGEKAQKKSSIVKKRK